MQNYRDLIKRLDELERNIHIYAQALERMEAIRKSQELCQVMRQVAAKEHPTELQSIANEEAYYQLILPALQSYYEFKKQAGVFLPSRPREIKALRIAAEAEVEEITEMLEAYAEHLNSIEKVETWLEKQKQITLSDNKSAFCVDKGFSFLQSHVLLEANPHQFQRAP